MLETQMVEAEEDVNQRDVESVVIDEYIVERIYLGERTIKDLLKEILIGRTSANFRNLR